MHSFGESGADADHPNGVLVLTSGVLYGTTSGGGTSGYGTVFSIDLSTGVETVIHSFDNSATDGSHPTGGLIDKDGTLYGTTGGGGTDYSGTVFSINLSSGSESLVYSFCSLQDCSDGSIPSAGLIDLKGTFYGTTYTGGAKGYGTVFSVTP